MRSRTVCALLIQGLFLLFPAFASAQGTSYTTTISLPTNNATNVVQSINANGNGEISVSTKCDGSGQYVGITGAQLVISSPAMTAAPHMTFNNRP